LISRPKRRIETEVFESKVLRRIFGSSEVIGDWRKLHKLLFVLLKTKYYGDQITKMRWAVHREWER
jgi:hypothetical protein